MKLIIDNVRTVITDINDKERKEIKGILTKKDPRTGFRMGSFDANRIKSEKFYYENKAGILFFTGLLSSVKPIIANKISSIENKIVTYNYQNKEYDYDELRSYFNPNFKYVDHQIRALKEMLNRTKGIVKATTSAGKTEIIIAFLKLSGLKSIVIAPKVDLANQLATRIKKAGLEVGIMTGSNKSYNNEQICVSTPQMALALADRNFDCIILDECHHASSKTYQDFLKSTKAKIMFGFSATPDTNEFDFFKIKQFLGNIVVEIGAEELVENGVIVYPEISFIPISQFNTSDWPTANDICIINNDVRNNKIKELCEESEKPVLILIRNIEHGETLNSMVDNSIFLSGRDDTEFRKDLFEKYENKEVDVLIGTIGVLSEGISLNSIRTLIYAAGGKSDIITVQALGRALRTKPGKNKVTVFDFADIGNKFCERHSIQRMKIYKEVGFPSKILKEDKR